MRQYIYKIQHEDTEKSFNSLRECLPYVNSLLNMDNFITKNILFEFITNTKTRKKHQIYFKNINISRVRKPKLLISKSI